MNRAVRRRQQKAKEQIDKEPVIQVKTHDIERIKKEATTEATQTAFQLMLGLPVMVMHDKHGWGKVRLERLTDQILELYESFNEGYLTLDDIHKVLLDECGIKLHRERGRR